MEADIRILHYVVEYGKAAGPGKPKQKRFCHKMVA